jgi:hypothetical protein
MNNKIILSEEFIRMQKLAGLITEEEVKVDPTTEKDAEQGLKQALAALKSGTSNIKPSPQDKQVDEALGLTLGLIAGAPGLINLLGKAVNFISAPFQNIDSQNKGTIVGNALKKMGHKLEDSYIGIIGDILKKSFPSKFQMQDVHDKTSALYDAAHGVYASLLIGAAVASGVGAVQAHSQILAGLEGGLGAFKTKEVVDLAQKIAAA